MTPVHTTHYTCTLCLMLYARGESIKTPEALQQGIIWGPTSTNLLLIKTPVRLFRDKLVLPSLKSRVCANCDLARELQNNWTTKIVIYIKYLGIKSNFLVNLRFKFQFSTYGYTRSWHGIGSSILHTDRIIGDGDDDKNDQMDGRER